ncbi:MAG: hypothetical protein J6K55_05680 [Clostridia bacterium]|nr:hypothetical protein [Clostridia bacterium]
MSAAAQQVRWIPMEEIVENAPDAAQGDVVLVRELAEGGYELLSGGDRLRRMREAGQVCVDAVLNPGEYMEEKLNSLLDELVRGTIHYLDEAQTYADLLSAGLWNTRQLAERLGRTPQTLRRKLRLLELPAEVTQVLRENGLCEGYAQELLRIPGQQGRLRVLRHVTDGGLSVKETEKLVDEVLSRMPVPMTGGRRMKPLMRDYRLYLNAIRDIVEQMCDAGLDASMNVKVGRHVAEVRITVPAFSQKPRTGGVR